jgi:hypothetical protein
MNPQYSKDYKALYLHLIGGGEAIALVDFKRFHKVERSAARAYREGPAVWIEHEGDAEAFTENEVDRFIAECTRLQLEYVTPGTELLKAEERIQQLEAALRCDEPLLGMRPASAQDVMGKCVDRLRRKGYSFYADWLESIRDRQLSLLNPQDHGNDK